jgi:L-lysine 2,3-aminomutase
MDELKFAMRETELMVKYVKEHPEISDILFTGGDPMIMKAKKLSGYIDGLLEADLPNLKTIRIGSKALGYWPQRFVTDDDADEILELFARVKKAGKHLAFMAHFNHPNEMDNSAVQEAIFNIRQTGAEIRTQAPRLGKINDSPDVWSDMWSKQVNLRLIPYYMFIERETGPFEYFGVPISRVYEIYSNAIRYSASFGKTLTGPVMSASKGKVHVMGTFENPADHKKYFMLQYVRHRDAKQTFKPFLAHYDENATWFDQLVLAEPAFSKAG